MTTTRRWIWPARVLRVVDGDTVDLEIDLGFRSLRRDRVRLVGAGGRPFDAPELRAPGPEGEAARAELAALLGGGEVQIETFRPPSSDKYGRWLAAIEIEGEKDVATILVDAGHGRWMS